MAILSMIGTSFVIPRKEPTLVSTHKATAPNLQRSESRIRDKQDVLEHYLHFTFLFRVKSRTTSLRLTNEKDLSFLVWL
jgi:hypothetical protein